MTNLKMLIDSLKRQEKLVRGDYFLPEIWNCFGFKDYTLEESRPGEIGVDPGQFYLEALKYIAAQASDNSIPAERSFKKNNGNLLCHKIIYSAFLRTLTAWAHYPGEPVCPGTFLKAIALLPFLKTLGADIIYLLPVFANGEKYKKGELGSPYAIKNFYQLDSGLHDQLLGEMTVPLLDTEFKAFVEASHILGLQVMVDFVFRTASRDNDLISSHPEWFYWIDLRENKEFSPPMVKKVKKASVINHRNVEVLYKSSELETYLAKFRRSPQELDPANWKVLQEKDELKGENILELVEKEYGVTTVPGFSDVLCDPQPPWEDVTYFRFYFDHHQQARKYVEPEQPPYLLQDVACLNLYQGELPNHELWEYIINIIPYYRHNFGIDGARIDMGHALPPALNRALSEKIREQGEAFILWSEEFNVKNSVAAKNEGYDFITGDLWQVYKEVGNKGFCRRLFSRLLSSELPLTGALEIPDSPRAAQFFQEKTQLELVVFLNYFLPKVIPLINNGMELMERQPMNLGLDQTGEGRYVLEKEDPMYGKLAFFDNYRLHWLNKDRDVMLSLLQTAAFLRKRFIHLLNEVYLSNGCYRLTRKKLIYFSYFDPDQEQLLIFVANRGFRAQTGVTFGELLPGELRRKFSEITLVYARGKEVTEQWSLKEKRWLKPGEVVIGVVE